MSTTVWSMLKSDIEEHDMHARDDRETDRNHDHDVALSLTHSPHAGKNVRGGILGAGDAAERCSANGGGPRESRKMSRGKVRHDHASVSDEEIVKALSTRKGTILISIVPMAMSLAQEIGWTEVRNVFVQAYSTIGIMAALMLSLVSGLLEIQEGSEDLKTTYGVLISTSFVLIFTGTLFCIHLLIHISLWTPNEMLKFVQVWNQLVLAPIVALLFGTIAFGVAFCFRMYAHYSRTVWMTACALASLAGLFLLFTFVRSSIHLRRQRLHKFYDLATDMKRTNRDGFQRLINS